MPNPDQSCTDLPRYKANQLAPGMRVGHLILQRRSQGSLKDSPCIRAKWKVVCTAGGHSCSSSQPFWVPQFYLTRENPKTHCGCLTSTEKSRNRKEYTAWQNMRLRCNYVGHPSYAEYGGRGISVYPAWDTLEGGFERFLAYMGNAPSPSHSLDRWPNNDGNYEPGNVRWATGKEQRSNQRPRRYKSRGEQ